MIQAIGKLRGITAEERAGRAEPPIEELELGQPVLAAFIAGGAAFLTYFVGEEFGTGRPLVEQGFGRAAQAVYRLTGPEQAQIERERHEAWILADC